MKKRGLSLPLSLFILLFFLSCAPSGEPELGSGEVPLTGEQKPAPELLPAPAPQPEPTPAPQPLPQPTPEPLAAPAPQPEPAPAPVAEPAPAPPPAPAPVPVTTIVSVDSFGNQANIGNNIALLDDSVLSPNGRFVAFGSGATNLVPGDTNAANDIFLHDTIDRTTKRVSINSNGNQGNNNGSFTPSISADGRFIVFDSISSNLIPNDTNGCTDIFLHDALNRTTTRLSVDSSGNQSDCIFNTVLGSFDPYISADGRFVAFSSAAKNLISNDTNNFNDIYIHDISTRATTRVSVDSIGNQSNGASSSPALSSDGRFVVFVSSASNLVREDTNNAEDIFVHDRLNRTTRRVSIGPSGTQSNSRSSHPSISSNGQFVVFDSDASNLVPGDTNGFFDIFLHNISNQTTIRVSIASSGEQGNRQTDTGSISADGRFVAFSSFASNLVPGDIDFTSDIFLHDTLSRTTIRVSVDPSGNQGNGQSQAPSVSSDGRFVLFKSTSSNLVREDTNSTSDFFLRRQ